MKYRDVLFRRAVEYGFGSGPRFGSKWVFAYDSYIIVLAFPYRQTSQVAGGGIQNGASARNEDAIRSCAQRVYLAALGRVGAQNELSKDES